MNPIYYHLISPKPFLTPSPQFKVLWSFTKDTYTVGNLQLTLVIVTTTKVLTGIPLAKCAFPPQAIRFQWPCEVKQMPIRKSDVTFVFNIVQSEHSQDGSPNPLATAPKLFEHDEVHIYQ